ncbi:MAG: PfkB family carbohydrate kinase [Pseudomonadota bacterium]
MRAYVIGNAVVDETYLVGSLPKEGESIHAVPRSRDVGGKGANQAVVLARAGVDVTLIAGLGEDARAETVRARLAKEPMDVRFVTVPGAATDMSVVMTTSIGGNAIITTNECAQTLDAPTIVPVLEEAVPGDVMVLQGNLSAATTIQLFDIADNRGMPVMFNPSPVQPAFADLLRRAAMVFVNEAEAAAFCIPARGSAGQSKARTGPIIVTTMGERGAMFAGHFEGAYEVSVPAKACPVIDSTGAGDTFQSAVLAALIRVGRISPLVVDNGLLRWAGQVGAAAAATSISRHGTLSALPKTAELKALLDVGPTTEH